MGQNLTYIAKHVLTQLNYKPEVYISESASSNESMLIFTEATSPRLTLPPLESVNQWITSAATR